MRGFRIGYIVTLSFLILFTGASLTLAFFKAPEGPQMPKYPEYPGSPALPYSAAEPAQGILPRIQQAMPGQPMQDIYYDDSTGSAMMPIATPTPYDYYQDPAQQEYQQKMDQYNKDVEKYQNDQKNFMKDKIVPYVKHVLVLWIVMLVAFELIGLGLVKIGSTLTGSAFAFTGVWAIIFGPIGMSVFLMNSLVSSYASRSEQPVSVEGIFQTTGFVGLAGVIILTVAGVLFEGVLKRRSHVAAPQA